ncbi:MAG TPA: urease subunit gamma [Nitrososphaera sp.]|nr:urease subunit gamma [Nitrososphaera sp.]
MIRVKATFKGEPDVPAFTRIFDSDDEIFFSSGSMVEEKIRRHTKINANEALVTYCSYVVKSVRAGKHDGEIKRGAAKILSADSVMIGVAETLQEITFEMIEGKVARKIVIEHPIPISGYIMAER